MINRKRELSQMTWLKFKAWQRRDEFPERSDNPPLTVDVSFFSSIVTDFLLCDECQLKYDHIINNLRFSMNFF